MEKRFVMRYPEFKKRSARKDISANDRAHFFSSQFGTPVAYVCYLFRLSPNNVTLVFCLVGLASAILLAKGYALFAYLAWRLHIILDIADGTIARATEVYSKSALGFDRSNHIIINTTILFAPAYLLEISYYSLNLLIVTFYLYYFFSRNYYENRQSTSDLSIIKNIIKNIIGLEGFIFSVCLCIWLELSDLLEYIVLVYSMFFLGMFLLKLRRFNLE